MPTKIEWCDEVWNPITGCSPVSEGCAHCYAKRMAYRLRGRYGYPADDPFKVTFHPNRLDQPLRWKKRRRVFVCSMGDLFHKDISREWITLIMSVISGCPGHTFMVLTKRPENALQYFRSIDCYWGMKNIWLGVTAENQARADERIPILLQIPTAKHFVSIEPMLEPMTLNYLQTDTTEIDALNGTHGVLRPHRGKNPRLDLVIVGGETGPGARPMDVAWARSLRNQCREAGTPFFFKKMGGNQPTPPDLMIREFPR